MRDLQQLTSNQRPTGGLSFRRVRSNAMPTPMFCVRANVAGNGSIDAMDAYRTERHVGRATWLHTPKFGPTHHFQRWRRAT